MNREVARQAFTMVEMLLVIVLLAALTGGLAVSFGGRQDKYALDMVAKDLAGAISFARQQARVKDRPHRIAFHESRRSYNIEIAKSSRGLEFEAVNGIPGNIRTLPKSIRIVGVVAGEEDMSPPPDFLMVLPGGLGFHGDIVLVADSGERKSVQVARKTGQVHIGKPPNKTN